MDDEDLMQRDPGLARIRTAMAWTRTALSFAGVGGVVLKDEVIPGVVILAMAVVVWWLSRTLRPGRLWLVTVTIVAVSVVALVVVFTSSGKPVFTGLLGACSPR
jgi:uncharacterized membrane protein YidH (DUF202 family)